MLRFKMKRFLVIGWFALALVGCANQPVFTVSGTMRGDHTMAYLWDRATRTYLDSVAMEEGQFRFEGVYEKPCQLTILDVNDPDKFRIHKVGATIGTYAGPGAIAVAFFAAKK
jgi:hypothetical protein